MAKIRLPNLYIFILAQVNICKRKEASKQGRKKEVKMKIKRIAYMLINKGMEK